MYLTFFVSHSQPSHAVYLFYHSVQPYVVRVTAPPACIRKDQITHRTCQARSIRKDVPPKAGRLDREGLICILGISGNALISFKQMTERIPGGLYRTGMLRP